MKRRLLVRLATFAFSLVTLGLLGLLILVIPGSPVSDAWNPFRPFKLTNAVTPITGWKLDRALGSLSSCVALLEDQAVERMADYTFNDDCHIHGRVKMKGVGQMNLAPVETRCAIAVRMLMWERETIQPAALRIFGSRVTKADHFGSYSCREVRTPEGSFGLMSKHATAEAIDVSGFRLANGRQITLSKDWTGDADAQEFLREVRDGACRWFKTTLGPDYNSFHHDHFHLQSRGWGTCK